MKAKAVFHNFDDDEEYYWTWEHRVLACYEAGTILGFPLTDWDLEIRPDPFEGAVYIEVEPLDEYGGMEVVLFGDILIDDHHPGLEELLLEAGCLDLKGWVRCTSC